MSKSIKEMQIAALKDAFRDVRDLVFLNVKGLTCQADNQFRHSLRKKNVRLMVVKNSLARRVLDEAGVKVDKDSPYWVGTTVVAWGAESVGELSRGLDDELKNPKTVAQYKEKITIKGAVVDGQPVSFERALKMPTRLEAIARVLTLALSPASRLAAQLGGPAGRVSSQIKTLSEKKPEEQAAAAEA